MKPTPAQEHDVDILNHALEAGLIRAMDFASLAAELADQGTSADALLVERGLISTQQWQVLLAMVRESRQASVPEEATLVSTPSDDSAAEDQPAEVPAEGTPAAVPSAHSSARVDVHAGLHGTDRESTQSRRGRTPTLPGASEPVQGAENPSQDSSRYTWERRFAQGGLGAVWLGTDERLQRRVALKEILPASRRSAASVARFLDEAKITGQLEHPGIVPVYDLGYKPNGCPFYAMKYVEGETFGEAIRAFHRESFQPLERTVAFHKLLRIYVDICQTIAFAHDRGFIHRDLKPSNVIIGKYGETLIVDWGLAKPIATPERSTEHGFRGSSPEPATEPTSSREPAARTHVGQVLGTPSYLSPEQARGQVNTLDQRSDIYALGVMLYELLVGRTPHAGSDSKTIIRNVSQGQHRPPRHANRLIPKPLDAICMKATAFHPAARYGSALDLADDINQWLAGEPVSAYAESMVERMLRVMRRHRQLVLWAGVSLCLITAITALANIAVRRAFQGESLARRAAETARDNERQARVVEAVAKQAALRNLDRALRSVDTWLLGLSGSLEFYPGLEPTRRKLLQRAALNYQELLEVHSDDPLVRDEHARARIRLGDVHQLLGDGELAVQEYRLAEHWFRERVAEAPPDSPLRMELANSLIGIGIAFEQDQETLDNAAETLTVACQLLDATQPAATDRLRWREARARCQLALARAANAAQNPTAAAQHYQEAHDELARLANNITIDDDARERARTLFHTVLFDQIRLADEQQEHATGLSLCRVLQDSLQTVRAEQPARPDWIKESMDVAIFEGNFLGRLGDVMESAARYEYAIDTFASLMETLYRGEFHSENLAIAHANLAQLLLQQGRTEDAIIRLTAARREFAALVRLSNYAPERMLPFASAAAVLGDAYLAACRTEEARQEFSTAAEVCRQLLEQDPAYGTAEFYGVFGKSVRQLVLLDAAEGALEPATTRLQSLLDAWPRDPHGRPLARNVYADSAWSLAELYALAGQMPEAERAGELALQALQDSADGEALALEAWIRAVGVALPQHDPELALRRATEATRQAPENPSTWSALAAANYGMGDWTGCRQAVARRQALRQDGSDPWDRFWLNLCDLAEQKVTRAACATRIQADHCQDRIPPTQQLLLRQLEQQDSTQLR